MGKNGMNFKKNLWAVGGVWTLFLVAGCGGGGGGSATSTQPPYAMTPSMAQASFVAGYPSQILMEARQTVAFSGPAYIYVVAEEPVLDSPIEVMPTSVEGTFLVSVRPRADLQAGSYSGNLTVSICKDVNCRSQLEGSPFKVPYDIQVISPEGGVTTFNLANLAPLPGASDWSTFQGNAAHTGFVPVTLNAAAFNHRWKWSAPANGGQQWTPSDLATGAGMFYVSHGTALSNLQHPELIAFRESDGSRAWSHSFADLQYHITNPPAFSQGKVFMAAGAQSSTYMFAFTAASGEQLFRSQMSSQWQNYLAPTVANGLVYTNGGTYGGMYAFDVANGTEKFFADALQFDGWTPAVNATRAYAYTGGFLYIYDNQTGASLGRITDPTYSWNGYTTAGAPVLGGTNIVYAGNLSYRSSNSIVSFDTLGMAVRWSIQGAYSGNPAYAGATLFAPNNSPFALEAYAESNGAKLWSWTPPPGNAQFVSDVLVTNNLVFVSTDTHTFAIDRSTHLPVWNYPASGSLALSANGLLYIKGATSIVAVNLR